MTIMRHFLMILFKLFIIISVVELNCKVSFADDKESGAFVIVLEEVFAVVKAPIKKLSEKTLIIRNKSFSKVFAKVIDEKGKVLGHLSVPAEGRFVGTYKVDHIDDDIFLILMAPSLHELQLKEGSSYEIPQSR